MQQHVTPGRMPLAAAKETIAAIDDTKPWANKLEFITAVAALVALYKDDVATSSTMRSRRVKDLLASMCKPPKLEFLLNNQRARHGMPYSTIRLLPVGTTAVEACNKQINSLIRCMGEYYLGTLLLKTTLFHWLHLASRNAALFRQHIRRRDSEEVAAIIAVLFRIPEAAWR